jgi:hypothetical protein
MFVLISGKQGSGKKTLSESLKKYYGYRGTAVYVYHIQQPIIHMHDALYSVGTMYGMKKPEAGKDGSLIQALDSWGRKVDPDVWAKIAQSKIKSITEKWDSLNLFYIVTIPGVSSSNEFKYFPNSFRVYLECREEVRKARATSWGDEHHSTETALEPYVAQPLSFDLVVDTEKSSPDEVAELIGKKLNERLNMALTKNEQPETAK